MKTAPTPEIKQSAISHAMTTLQFVRDRSDEIILFYSGGGKDSIILLDLCSKMFKKVHCVFMYLVKDLEHQKPYLTYLKKYKNTVLYQVPHWNLFTYIANGEGIYNKQDIPKVKLEDIEKFIKRKTGCEWVCYGMKQSDSMHRRIFLGTYLYDSISVATKKIYPLSKWKKADVLRYIAQKRLIKPTQYGMGNSQGLDLTPEPLIWLKANYPNDYEKLCKQFPKAKGIVFAYEEKIATLAPQNQNSSNNGKSKPKSKTKSSKKASQKETSTGS